HRLALVATLATLGSLAAIGTSLAGGELVTGKLAVLVRVELVETGGGARLAVASVDLAVLVDVEPGEYLAGLGLGFGPGDGAVAIGLRRGVRRGVSRTGEGESRKREADGQGLHDLAP